MGQLYSYKTTHRTERLQNIEEVFGNGMQYTNTPLNEGFSKLLINYDFKDDGMALQPRPGLRVKRLFTAASSTKIKGTEQIFAAKEQQFVDKQRAQMFVRTSMETADSGVLRKGSMAMLTATGSDKLTPSFANQVEQDYDVVEYPNANFVVPESAEIHNVPLKTSDTLARQVGTFAWNNNYYFLDPVSKVLVHSEYDSGTDKYKFVTDKPKEIDPKTAVTHGYNMLLDNPYTFKNILISDGLPISFTGMLPYSPEGELQLTPLQNQSLEFKVFYKAPKTSKYKIVWEWRSMTDSNWTKLSEKEMSIDVTASTSTELSITFSPPTEAIVMRITAFETGKELAAATLAVGFNFKKKDYGATANIATQNYNLFNCSGMCFWNNRLIVWGCEKSPNILLSSDVNDPTYFPYPNATDTFDEPIKYAVAFMDNLLVFTSTKLYMCTIAPDGLTWTRKLIQSNLTIADWDIHLIQIVKNMVFFRSGNYFYMIVPKRMSTTGELSVASISKPLVDFFDNFYDNVKTTLEQLYGTPNIEQPKLELIHYYDYLDFEDVHVCYTFKEAHTPDKYINFCALYNVVDRSWRCYTIGSTHILEPYRKDATQKGAVCSMASVKVGETTVALPEVLEYDVHNAEDFYLWQRTTPGTFIEDFKKNYKVKNWQYLDTGYREHNSNFKKRYRELQFVINNVSNKELYFYTDFFIDGENRNPLFEYNVVETPIDGDPNKVLLTVERVYTSPKIAPGTTALGFPEGTESTDINKGLWRLNISQFPDASIFKIRFPVSGKGYAPKLVIISHNEAFYELLNVSWVYRNMYSR